jgi:tRNA1Val (adenine37-N6)-methyltransferase
MEQPTFTFKQFALTDRRCAMKIGTDGVLLGAWTDCLGCSSVIDIGAGSGLISLMIAQRSPQCRIAAVEIDAGAAADAADNVAASPFADRVAVVNVGFSDYRPTAPVDLIVSNPPFFTSGIRSDDLTRAAARHQGELTYESLAAYAAANLSDFGSYALIAPADELDYIIYVSEMQRLKLNRLCRVSPSEGKPPKRVMCQFSRRDAKPVYQDLAIRDSVAGYTADFRQLTADFYLKF